MTCPKECVIAFALPTTEQGFGWSAQQEHSDYVHRFAAGWDQYRGVCEDLRHCINQCTKVGVQIVEQVTFEQWHPLFCNRVVALFAHWITGTRTAGGLELAQHSESNGLVELWDCRASVSDLVEAIPEGFDGVLDLSVCHPSTLVDKIKRCRRNCTVRYFPNEVLPSVWAEMYVAVFKYLGQFREGSGGGNSKSEGDYCDVLEQVAREFGTQAGGRQK
jgi:hypothetical protein